ncbi:hypothetical protein DQ238_07100 [Geodermatophilus sp. TF02-6]|nr:hypothetical protein DQ238_07100 [Geodermatophilus sp. TF02-6]
MRGGLARETLTHLVLTVTTTAWVAMVIGFGARLRVGHDATERVGARCPPRCRVGRQPLRHGVLRRSEDWQPREAW